MSQSKTSDQRQNGPGGFMKELEFAGDLYGAADYLSAVKVLESLRERYPNRVDVLYALGQSYAACGDADLARDSLAAALRLNPADPDVAQALERLKKPRPPVAAPSSSAMSDLVLPGSDEEFVELQRRVERKEQVGQWARLRAVPSTAAETEEYVRLTSQRERLERRAFWRSQSWVARAVVVVIFCVVGFGMVLGTLGLIAVARSALASVFHADPAGCGVGT